MHIGNTIKNLLDTKRRREVVRLVASTRGRIAEAQQAFGEFRMMLARLNIRVASLESEGATPQDVVDCLNAATTIDRLARKSGELLKKFQINIKPTLRHTPENSRFSKRVAACGEKLKRRVDVSKAEVNQWALMEPHDMIGLISRIGNLKPWHKMTGVEFETLIINKLRMQGFSAQGTKGSGEVGIDIIAVWQGSPFRSRDLLSNLVEGRKYLIKCKRYDKLDAVGTPTLSEFYRSMKRTDANAEGILITTSGFTSSAVEYASRLGIRLIDGAELDRILSH